MILSFSLQVTERSEVVVLLRTLASSFAQRSLNQHDDDDTTNFNI